MGRINRYDAPTELLSGAGAIAQLPDEVRWLGAGRVVVVTDAGLVKAGIAEKIERYLRDASLWCATYADVPAGPTFADVDAVVAGIRDQGADAVVSVGSGSVLAVGRSAALVATHAGPASALAGVKRPAAYPCSTSASPPPQDPAARSRARPR